MEQERNKDSREESDASFQVAAQPLESGSEKTVPRLSRTTIQTEGGAYFAGSVTNQGGLSMFGGRIEGGVHFRNTYENVLPRPVEQAVIAAAIQKLSTLPLDRPPVAGTFPPASRLPAFARNSSFVGRERELARMANILKARNLATVAITGLGGVGKSQLASEFVYRYGQYFAGGVFWLSFANADAVAAEVVMCTIALDQEIRLDVRTLSVEEQVNLVLSCWQNPLPRLLVFDNCEDESLLACPPCWLPRIGGCRILITSRREVWHPHLGVSVVPLDVLPRAKSVELLGAYRSDLSVRDRELIALELGDLPLALSMAGLYLHTYQESRLGDPQRYLLALRQVSPLEHSSMQQEGSTYTTGHIEHVARTFALSYEQLNPSETIDATALQLLAHVACFAPGEPIPRDLLRMTMGSEGNKEDKDPFAEALTRAYALGLLTTQQEGTQQMHRLLVTFVQKRLASTGAATKAQTAVEVVVLRRAREVNATGYPAPLLRLQEHLRTVTARASERGDVMAANLNAALGEHLSMVGAYQEAQRYLEYALSIQEQSLGPEHLNMAFRLHNLAFLYTKQGKYTEAEPMFQRALHIQEQSLGLEHPQVTESLYNLASLYCEQSRYTEAEPLYQRALHIWEQNLEPEHPRMAFSLNGLAVLYTRQGKYTEAEPLYLRALRIREQSLGPEHPDVAFLLIGLAVLCTIQDKYAQAEQLYQRALHIQEQSLGPEHPDIAFLLIALATLYSEQDKYAQAEQLYQRALHIQEPSLGPEHPRMAFSLIALATLYGKQGKYTEAEPMFQRALHICEQSLGLEHLQVASSLIALATLYSEQDKYAQAEQFYQRALHIQEQSLGPEHPDVASSLIALASLYKQQGKYAQAEQLYQRALSIYEETLGPDHRQVGRTLVYYASLSARQWKFIKAMKLAIRGIKIVSNAIDQAKTIHNQEQGQGKEE